MAKRDATMSGPDLIGSASLLRRLFAYTAAYCELGDPWVRAPCNFGLYCQLQQHGGRDDGAFGLY